VTKSGAGQRMTGAELRAWRERLGKDEAWIERVLGAVFLDEIGTGDGHEEVRREAVEGRGTRYREDRQAVLRDAYIAALEAEERAQAERKLDAVKAAEEAHRATNRAYADAIGEHAKTERAMETAKAIERDAWEALTAARREAGL
jgi:hypothetical protein